MSDQQLPTNNSTRETHSISEKVDKGSPEVRKLNTFIRRLSEKAHKIDWQMWSGIVGILGLIVTVIFGFLSLSSKVADVQDTMKNVQRGVQNVERLGLARQFVITSPIDGTTVALTDLVRGNTPFPEMNHYVIVTPLDAGDDWVQDNPVKVHASGTWTARARFGASDAGASEKFIVRCLATNSRVPPGPLTVVPEDAVFSEPITVMRKQ